MPRSRNHVFVFLYLVLGLSTTLFAQRDLGTLTGTVADSQGAAVPNAKVLILEEATGLTYDLLTDSNGAYVRPLLKPGTYAITVEAAGFQKAQQKGILVSAGDRVAVNISLQVGDISQTVEVSAAAPLLQTENTTLGANLGSKSVSELPLGGQRTFTFLARLSPGVVPAEPGARDANGGGFSANGVRSNGQNNFLLNGVDNNVNVIDFLNQTAFVIGPSVEAIGEMRVLTNGYNAEYGRGAGGVLDVDLKSGTNEIHGTAFEILQNEKLNANRWENNEAGTARGAIKQNQFGLAMGGPIIKNRTFIFGDYQGTRISSTGGAIAGLGSSGFYTIATQAMKTGDFSGVGIPIYDPTTTRTVNGSLVRDAYVGNKIPVSQMDPAALKIIQSYPSPNQPVTGGSYPQNDYFASTAGSQTVDQGDVRVDHRISEKDSVFGSLSWSDTSKSSVPPFPGALDGGGFAGNTEVDLGRNAQISYTRVWSPRILTETRVGYTRMVTTRTQYDPTTDQFTAFGIGGYNPTTAATQNGGLPQIGLGRYSTIGANDWLPTKEYSNVWDFIQNVAINKGSHSFKFGAEFRPIKFPFYQVPYPHGELNFSQNETAYPSTVGSLNTKTGDEMASFLLGAVNNGQVSTTNFIASEKIAWGFYAQDDWKLSPKLTISAGIRYELFSPISEKFGRQSNFNYDTLTLDIPSGKDQNAALPPNFATDFANVTVSRGKVSKYLIPWDKLDLAPRLGIAYNIRPKTVLRVSYGIFFGGEENQGGSPNRGESVPFNESPSLARQSGTGLFDPNPYFANGAAIGGVSAGYPLDVFSLAAPVTFRSVAQNFQNSMVQKWNLAIQHELPGNMALEVAYIGNHQSHALIQNDPNTCPNYGTNDSSITCNSLRPYTNIGSVSGTASFGYGNYNALTAKLEKRFSQGLQFISAYTYGHALANSGTTLSGSTGLGTLDPTNYGTSYTSASWDIRHNFTTGFQYEVPFGKGKTYGAHLNPVVNAIAGNWQLNGILTLRTGVPFTLRSNACEGVWNACVPDVVSGLDPNAAPSGGRTPQEWFNTAAVTAPAALTGGNAGLQTNYGPPTRNLDFSIFKQFPIKERFNLQFRAESLNLTNTPQFSIPDNNLQDANFGKITTTTASSERHIQFSLRLQF
jgi:hypothetical protein